VTAYAGTVAALERLGMFGIRLGLDNVRAALDVLGHPERAWPAIHVAGTNGKGTTAAVVAALASAHGRRVGLYLSPHLVDLRERIRIDGCPVDGSAIVRGWERVGPIVEARRMTYFEATTLLAFLAFAEARVDLTVVETGLGGRLDATNTVEPVVTVVTNVARDHEAWLGTELAGIAREKAGIFKPGVPALVGDPGPDDVRHALESTARTVGAPLSWLGDEATWSVREVGLEGVTFDYTAGAVRLEGLRLPAAGSHFAAGAALGLRAWSLSGGALDPGRVRGALAAGVLGGRGEWRVVDGVGVLFDVAHNDAAVARLAATLRSFGGRWSVVAGILSDKPYGAMLAGLDPVAARIRLCGLASAPPDRALDPAAAASGLDGVEPALSVEEALHAAREEVAAGEADAVLVTGSFHTVGEALVALGMARAGEPYTPSAPAAAVAAGRAR